MSKLGFEHPLRQFSEHLSPNIHIAAKKFCFLPSETGEQLNYIYIYNRYTHTHMYTCVYMCKDICTYIHTHTHICMPYMLFPLKCSSRIVLSKRN